MRADFKEGRQNGAGKAISDMIMESQDQTWFWKAHIGNGVVKGWGGVERAFWVEGVTRARMTTSSNITSGH